MRKEAHTSQRIIERESCCARCGYNLRGLAVPRCPECGHEIVRGRERPMGWRVHAVDLVGIGIALVVNTLLAVVVACGVIGAGRQSWFTVPRFRWGRGQDSISSLLLWAIALCVLAWFGAWQSADPRSFRWQVACAVVAGLLTVFHAVGAGSLLR